MKKMTMMELMRMTRVELLDLEDALLMMIHSLPDDAPEHIIIRSNLDLVRHVLARRQASSHPTGPSL